MARLLDLLSIVLQLFNRFWFKTIFMFNLIIAVALRHNSTPWMDQKQQRTVFYSCGDWKCQNPEPHRRLLEVTRLLVSFTEISLPNIVFQNESRLTVWKIGISHCTAKQGLVWTVSRHHPACSHSFCWVDFECLWYTPKLLFVFDHLSLFCLQLNTYWMKSMNTYYSNHNLLLLYITVLHATDWNVS